MSEELTPEPERNQNDISDERPVDLQITVGSGVRVDPNMPTMPRLSEETSNYTHDPGDDPLHEAGLAIDPATGETVTVTSVTTQNEINYYRPPQTPQHHYQGSSLDQNRGKPSQLRPREPKVFYTSTGEPTTKSQGIIEAEQKARAVSEHLAAAEEARIDDAAPKLRERQMPRE